MISSTNQNPLREMMAISEYFLAHLHLHVQYCKNQGLLILVIKD